MAFVAEAEALAEVLAEVFAEAEVPKRLVKRGRNYCMPFEFVTEIVLKPFDSRN